LLSKREDEVARLVADGLTNKEIGARLFISEHTVDSHVRAILNKLGFDSRARIAAWVAANE
jgi:DNA-binding CsgD family transcriptional regulator